MIGSCKSRRESEGLEILHWMSWQRRLLHHILSGISPYVSNNFRKKHMEGNEWGKRITC